MDPGEPTALPLNAARAEQDGLITRAIRGDQDALRELWNEHRRWVAAVLLAHMPRTGGPDLDDLLQEVAVTVVAKISGLRDEAAFKPWLRAVALSIAKTSGRRTKVRRTGWLRLVGRAEGESDERTVARREGVGEDVLHEGRRLMDLSADLPDGYREPLMLKCVHGMSYKQIGQVMGLPDTTVETRIARARRMLRERAEQVGVGQRPGAEEPTRSDDTVRAGAPAGGAR